MTRSTAGWSGRRGLLAGLTAAVIALTALVAARGGDDSQHLRVHVLFADASPLLEGNDVRMNGVRVGTIAKMSQVAGGADVLLDLDRAALPIHQDASAAIRPDSLLGERYVDLRPGSADAPQMPSGGTIATGSTRVSTDLDTVLNSLDDPTSTALAALVGSLGTGLDRNGEDVRDAVKALAPALTDTDALVAILRDQDDVLGRLVTSVEGVAQGLAVDEGTSLDHLVSSVDGILSTTAAQEEALRSVLRQLPDTLTTARRTLASLEQTAVAAEPTLRSLRPTTSDLSAVSKELGAFSDAATPALAAADPVLKRAADLLDRARPVAEALRKAGPDLRTDVQSVEPITRDLTRNLLPVFEFIRGWALTTNGRDGLSHYFRANVVVTTGMVTGLVPSLNHLPQVTVPSLNDVPLLGGLLSNLGLGGVLSGLGNLTGGSQAGGGLLGGLLSNRTTADGGVTGLTRQQELNAMSFMLGGR